MMQSFESYTASSECYLLWQNLQTQKVSPAATQLQSTENQSQKFVSAVLTQTSWTNHREIFSAVKIAEQRLFTC
jgi:hypothetical protein